MFGSYVIMFWSAVVTFVWLGVIEYMQQEMRLTDRDLLDNPYFVAKQLDYTVDGVADLSDKDAVGIFFRLEYDPTAARPEICADPTGPYCETHHHELKYEGKGPFRNHTWRCEKKESDKTIHWSHKVILADDRHSLRDKVLREGRAQIRSSVAPDEGSADDAPTTPEKA
jgi:hypothetical protein